MAAALLLTACVAGQSSQTTTGSCLPEFPLKDGWLGGDSAYSIILPDQSTLWFFGDTFVARTDRESRAEAAFIANSLARSTCTPEGWSIEYDWGNTRRDPQPFFALDGQDGAPPLSYWPLSSFLHNGKLYLFLERVQRLSGGPFGFRIVGVDLATIDNPLADPADWTIAIAPLHTGDDAIPGVANIKQERFVYLFTTLAGTRAPRHPVILTRLPLDGLDRPADNLHHYAPGGFWREGIDAKNAVRIMAEGATEMSVRYAPEQNRYIAVMTSPTPFADHAEIRFGRTPAGPWSPGVRLFYYQDQRAARERGDTQIFCYASKEHAQFSTRDSLLVTYACNSLNDRILRDTSLYVPKAEFVSLPAGR